MKVAIIGTGHVAQNIGKGLIKKHEVIYGSRNPDEARSKVPKKAKVESMKQAAEEGEVIILAVPYKAAADVIKEIKDSISGKVLVDVTNALNENFEWAKGFSESVAEEIAGIANNAKVVKAFNTVFAENMSKGKIGREKLTLFVAGNDENAKKIVMDLAKDLGFVPVDVGDIKAARYLEPMGLLLIHLGYKRNLGTGIGFKLVGIKEQSEGNAV